MFGIRVSLDILVSCALEGINHTLIPLLELLLVKVGRFLQLVELRGRKLRLSVDFELETMFAKTTDQLEPQTEVLVTRVAQYDLHRGISGSPSRFRWTRARCSASQGGVRGNGGPGRTYDLPMIKHPGPKLVRQVASACTSNTGRDRRQRGEHRKRRRKSVTRGRTGENMWLS